MQRLKGKETDLEHIISWPLNILSEDLVTSLTYLPENSKFKNCDYSLQKYCKFKNNNFRRIQTFQLKAAVDLRIKCDGHILKRYFPSVSLIILLLYWISILKNSLNRHDYMYQTQIYSETSQRKWDKLRKFYKPNCLFGYPSDQCVNCDQLLLSGLFGFFKAQYRYRQPCSWFFMCK